MSGLADLLGSAAGRAGAAGAAVAGARGVVGLAQLHRDAADLERALKLAASRSTPVVLVELGLGVALVGAVVAAVRGGCVLAVVDPSGGRRAAVEAALDPDVVLDAAGLTARRPTSDAAPAAGHVAMSSGSTGAGAKAVLTRWDDLAAFAPAAADVLEVDASALWAEPSHLSFDLAFTNVLLALCAGAGVRVGGGLVDQLRPLTFAGKAGATHVRLAPRYADLATAEAARARAGDPAARPAPELRVWGSGGDRLAARQARDLHALGVPLVVNTYGTSETGGFASAARFAAGEEVPERHGTAPVSRAASGAVADRSVRLVESADGPLLSVRTPSGGGHLFGGEGAEFPRWGADGVLTGDLGAADDDGLYCLGRVGRLVKRAGVFVNLDDVDAALASARGWEAHTVAAADGELVTLLAAGPDSVDAAQLRDALAGTVPPDALPARVVVVPALPRLGNGKVDQTAARAAATGSEITSIG